MKESREKFLDRYRAISDASTEASVAGDSDSSTSPSSSGAKKIDLTVSNEAIRLSVREVMRKEWESMREEESSLPQLPSGRTSAEEYYMEQVNSIMFVHSELVIVCQLAFNQKREL